MKTLYIICSLLTPQLRDSPSKYYISLPRHHSNPLHSLKSTNVTGSNSHGSPVLNEFKTLRSDSFFRATTITYIFNGTSSLKLTRFAAFDIIVRMLIKPLISYDSVLFHACAELP